jgi:hypothetical protein
MDSAPADDNSKAKVWGKLSQHGYVPALRGV